MVCPQIPANQSHDAAGEQGVWWRYGGEPVIFAARGTSLIQGEREEGGPRLGREEGASNCRISESEVKYLSTSAATANLTVVIMHSQNALGRVVSGAWAWLLRRY